jgi:hypothetical protein
MPVSQWGQTLLLYRVGFLSVDKVVNTPRRGCILLHDNPSALAESSRLNSYLAAECSHSLSTD